MAATTEPVAPVGATAGRYEAFLSYAREDSEFAVGTLRGTLQARGHDVWVDVEDIVGGAKWRDRVRRGIEACRTFVFVISPDSVSSNACRQELEEAVGLNKPIIPVVHRDVDDKLVPPAAAEVEWIFLRDSDDRRVGLDKLIDALQTDLVWRDEHTRLAGRTREWLDAGRDRSYLLRGNDLREAEEWLAHQAGHRESPTPQQAEYITRSRQAANRRLQLLTGAVVVGLLVAVALGIVAVLQRSSAITARDNAQSELLASKAGGFIDPAVASLFALEAYRIAPTNDAENAVIGVANSFEDGTPLSGHTNAVQHVAVSPDGKMLATASMDKTIRLWDVATRRQIGPPLTGDTNTVMSVAFSPDGKTVASASWDGTVRLWSVARHEQIGPPFEGHLGQVESVDFSPDGKTLVSGGEDKTVRLWDVATHREIGSPLRGHAGAIIGVAFNPGGTTVASASADDTIRLWSVSTHRQIGAAMTAAASDSGGVNSIAFSPDGRMLVSGADDASVRLWDVRTHHEIGSPMSGNGSGVYAVTFSPNGKTIASAGADRTVRLWDVATRIQLGSSLIGNSQVVNSVAFGPGGRWLVSGSADDTVRFWDLWNHREIGAPITAGAGFGVNAIAFSPDGRTVASGGGDGTLRLWDVITHQSIGGPLVPAGSNPKEPIQPILSVAYSPQGNLVATGQDHYYTAVPGAVRLWSVKTHRQLGPPLATSTAEPGGASVAFSPNGRLLAATLGNSLSLFDVATRKELGRSFLGAGIGIYDVAFSPTGKLIATASGDRTIRLWSVASHRQVGSAISGPAGAISGVAFSPDGRMLASGSYDDTVRFWDVATHRELGAPLTGHTDAVVSVAFSPDGKTLASASQDGSVRLWDVRTRRQIGAPLTSHIAPVASVVFSPRGGMLASGSYDGTIRFWNDYSLAYYVHAACSYIDERKTRSTWSQIEPKIPYHQPC